MHSTPSILPAVVVGQLSNHHQHERLFSPRVESLGINAAAHLPYRVKGEAVLPTRSVSGVRVQVLTGNP